MKWTISRIEGLLQELSKSNGDQFSIPVTINGRLTSTFGRVFHRRELDGYKPLRMEFSKQLLETASDESIVDVIKHEWCHYYITKTTKQNHGHDWDFKRLCYRIGCGGSPTTAIERVVEVKEKYELFCSDCGKKVGGYARVCSTIHAARDNRVKTRCCKATVTVKQNW